MLNKLGTPRRSEIAIKENPEAELQCQICCILPNVIETGRSSSKFISRSIS